MEAADQATIALAAFGNTSWFVATSEIAANRVREVFDDADDGVLLVGGLTA